MQNQAIKKIMKTVTGIKISEAHSSCQPLQYVQLLSHPLQLKLLTRTAENDSDI
jgi:hypothetical protein